MDVIKRIILAMLSVLWVAMFSGVMISVYNDNDNWGDRLAVGGFLGIVMLLVTGVLIMFSETD